MPDRTLSSGASWYRHLAAVSRRPRFVFVAALFSCVSMAIAGLQVNRLLATEVASGSIRSTTTSMAGTASGDGGSAGTGAPEAADWAIHAATLSGPAAPPFDAVFSDEVSHRRSIECLTSALYYEAALEGEAGQRAVAQVVLNRVRHTAYPNSICGVVYQGANRRTGCQFTFTCDGSTARGPLPGLWQKAKRIARGMLAGEVFAPVGYSTHYHADYVAPGWRLEMQRTAMIGKHVFYRFRGAPGMPRAFAASYAGKEWSPGPEPAALEGETVIITPAASGVALADLPDERNAEQLDTFGLLKYREVQTAHGSGWHSDPKLEATILAAGAAVGPLKR
ncbi:cell wall hydrolase [Erythrobacter sp. NFXS35]|uniref:cell wall hydrolase n=1 Tax=Erythrobacter sp. NFXS35 TaxID=2818436 RepID=UPI0032DE537B